MEIQNKLSAHNKCNTARIEWQRMYLFRWDILFGVADTKKCQKQQRDFKQPTMLTDTDGSWRRNSVSVVVVVIVAVVALQRIDNQGNTNTAHKHKFKKTQSNF